MDKGIFDYLRQFVCRFQALKGPRGSPMVLNGQISVLWEVKIKYSIMGWFHYGNIEHYSLERWTMEYLMIWGFFLLFSGNERPLGSWMVLKGQTSGPCEVEIKYFTMGWFYYGNTERYSLERWRKGYFMIFEAFCFSFQALKGPLMSPTVLNGQTSVPYGV